MEDENQGRSFKYLIFSAIHIRITFTVISDETNEYLMSFSNENVVLFL